MDDTTQIQVITTAYLGSPVTLFLQLDGTPISGSWVQPDGSLEEIHPALLPAVVRFVGDNAVAYEPIT